MRQISWSCHFHISFGAVYIFCRINLLLISNAAEITDNIHLLFSANWFASHFSFFSMSIDLLLPMYQHVLYSMSSAWWHLPRSENKLINEMHISVWGYCSLIICYPLIPAVMSAWKLWLILEFLNWLSFWFQVNMHFHFASSLSLQL